MNRNMSSVFCKLTRGYSVNAFAELVGELREDISFLCLNTAALMVIESTDDYNLLSPDFFNEGDDE